MKKCPKCFQTFTNDNRFCLSDGTPLENLTNFNPLYAVISILALIVIGLSAFLFLRETKETPLVKVENNQSNFNLSNSIFEPIANSNQSKQDNLDQERIKQEKANLQIQKEQLEIEKQKLNREKTKLNEQKNQNTTTNSVSSGKVTKPPSNVRESPTTNSAVLCKITSRTTIRIYGSSNITDENGVWYYTDFCGKMGYIHSGQFTF
ncbi:MAG TPA: SH3 domain-containing protein [Pyrinomonadaceae bacterium]|nr:SH3 domain-containing protein [Pyrinomonadaceae bacterium]